MNNVNEFIVEERRQRRQALMEELVHSGVAGTASDLTAIADRLWFWIEDETPAPKKKKPNSDPVTKALKKTLKTGKRKYTKKSAYWK